MTPNTTGAVSPNPSVVEAVATGHWNTDEGRMMAERYASKSRHDLCHGDMSDFELANRQYMADRNDLDLLGWQTAAKDRIRWLSTQLAIALAALNKDQAGV